MDRLICFPGQPYTARKQLERIRFREHRTLFTGCGSLDHSETRDEAGGVMLASEWKQRYHGIMSAAVVPPLRASMKGYVAAVAVLDSGSRQLVTGLR